MGLGHGKLQNSDTGSDSDMLSDSDMTSDTPRVRPSLHQMKRDIIIRKNRGQSLGISLDTRCTSIDGAHVSQIRFSKEPFFALMV